MNQLQVCAITGGSSGIGAACAEGFLAQSPNNAVTILDLKIDHKFQQKLLSQYTESRVQFIQLDVTDTNKHKQIFAQIFQKYKRLDVFINNAGIGIQENTIIQDDTTDLDKYNFTVDKILGVNLIAVIRLTVLAIYYMRINNIKGHIINVSSMGSVNPQGICPLYSATKHAVNGFSRSLYYVNSKYGIRINTLCPSFIETPLVLTGIEQTSGKRPQEGELINLGVALKASDVSDAFLLVHDDKKANGELVFITPNLMQIGSQQPKKIRRQKYRDLPRFPGEHEIGGMISRVPDVKEIKDYQNLITQLAQKKPKL